MKKVYNLEARNQQNLQLHFTKVETSVGNKLQIMLNSSKMRLNPVLNDTRVDRKILRK